MRRKEKIDQIARDCVHFKGDRPCVPHKRTGALCRCPGFSPLSSKILVIQLSSAATVIRSSALLHRLRAEGPNSHITYVTAYQQLLPGIVNERLMPDGPAMLRLQMDHFDVAYNLDLDKRACAIMNVVDADVKHGFYLRQGGAMPLNSAAEAIYLHNVMPHSMSDKPIDKVRELFQLSSLEYQQEKPRLEIPSNDTQHTTQAELIVGINTEGVQESPGQADRGSFFRDWSEDNWSELTEMFAEQGLKVALLGSDWAIGPDSRIAQHHSGQSLAVSNLQSYISQVARCDIVVTHGGWVMELACALGKDVVVLRGNSEGGEETRNIPRCSIVTPEADRDRDNSLGVIQPGQLGYAVIQHLGQSGSHQPLKSADIQTSSLNSVGQ